MGKYLISHVIMGPVEAKLGLIVQEPLPKDHIADEAQMQGILGGMQVYLAINDQTMPGNSQNMTLAKSMAERFLQVHEGRLKNYKILVALKNLHPRVTPDEYEVINLAGLVDAFNTSKSQATFI